MQRRQGMAACPRCIGRRCGCTCILLEHAHYGIDGRIDLVEATERRIDGIARRGLAGADEPREIRRVILPEVHVIFLQLFLNFMPKNLAALEGLG